MNDLSTFRRCATSATLALSLFSTTGLASAQETAGDGPPASHGFQLSLRTGYSLPAGKASGAAGDDQSKTFGGQVPIIADIGGKLSPNVILAGYVGVAFGSVGSGLENTCKQIDCSVVGARLGIEIFYQFAPSSSTNPWLGYGIGFERTSIGLSGNGRTGSVSASGPEFAHLMGGIDFRLNSTFGVGPFLDLAVAQYSKVEVDIGDGSGSRDITDKAIHEWLTIGAKFTFWP